MTSIIIPANVDVIGANAFKNCTNLEKVVIQNANIDIGDGAFPSGTKVIIDGNEKIWE